VRSIYKHIPWLIIAFIVGGCGYHNPNVYSGPDKTIYISAWQNRTSNLDLDSQIYRSLTRWFQKSGSISTVRNKDEADFILSGEIISIELPSLSYGAGNITTEVKVKLRVRYRLKEISSNKNIIEVGDETWAEDYLVSTNISANRDNEREALKTIIKNLSQKIYQRTVSQLPKL